MEKENYLHYLMGFVMLTQKMTEKLKDFGMGKVMKIHLNFHLRRQTNLH